MRRPHESPECRCPGCVEWDKPSPFAEAFQREVEGALDNYINKFSLLMYRAAVDSRDV